MRRLWRLPRQTFVQVAVEDGGANLQHAMRAFERPLHLLLFDHSAGDRLACSRALWPAQPSKHHQEVTDPRSHSEGMFS